MLITIIVFSDQTRIHPPFRIPTVNAIDYFLYGLRGCLCLMVEDIVKSSLKEQFRNCVVCNCPSTRTKLTAIANMYTQLHVIFY